MTQSRDMAVALEVLKRHLPNLDAAAMPTKSEVFVVCGSEAAEMRDAIQALANRDAPGSGSGSSAKADTQPGSADSNSQWRPIETAPKDGTHFLCCDAETPYVGGWTFNQRPPTVCHYWGGLGEEGFYTSVNEREPDHPFPATHWMPLPAPPAINTTAGEEG